MKKFIAVLMLVSLIAVFVSGTFAFGESVQQQFVVDKFNAFGTVGESELQRLNTLANEIYRKYDYAIYYIVTDNLTGLTNQEYAKLWFMENSPCEDGVVFVDYVYKDYAYEMYYAGSAISTIKPNYETIRKAYYDAETYPIGCEEILKAVSAILDKTPAEKLHAEPTAEEKKAAEEEVAGKSSPSGRAVDKAGLLKASELKSLNEKLDALSDSCDNDITVVTDRALEGITATEYAARHFVLNGYGRGNNHSGVMLLYLSDSKEWYIIPLGDAKAAFTDAGLEFINGELEFEMLMGKYPDAFGRFGDLANDFLLKAKGGKPYDADDLPESTARQVVNNPNEISERNGNFRQVLKWIVIAVLIVAAGFAIWYLVKLIREQE